MTGDLDQLGRVVADLLVRTAPAERRRVLRTVAREIRKSQADRIAAQQNPDGTPFAPRRPQASRLRGQGKVRAKPMFSKLRMAKHLKGTATADEATIGFTGRAGRIARVHQEGLPDRPVPGAKPVRYARRVLLGLTAAEQARVVDLVLSHVTR